MQGNPGNSNELPGYVLRAVQTFVGFVTFECAAIRGDAILNGDGETRRDTRYNACEYSDGVQGLGDEGRSVKMIGLSRIR